MANQWLQHTLQRTGWRPQNQAVALAALGIVLAAIIGALYLSQVASFATTNRQIEGLLEERDRLERDNERLRAEIATLRTLQFLELRARDMGFRPATAADIEYLLVPGYNPDRSVTVVELGEQTQLLPVYDETFLGWLQQQWDLLRRQLEGFGMRQEP